jgi:hypothetical protein
MDPPALRRLPDNRKRARWLVRRAQVILAAHPAAVNLLPEDYLNDNGSIRARYLPITRPNPCQAPSDVPYAVVRLLRVVSGTRDSYLRECPTFRQ